MHQVTRMHRTLVVLAVGLLALAAPLVAYADGGGPERAARPTMHHAPTTRPAHRAGLVLCLDKRQRRRA